MVVLPRSARRTTLALVSVALATIVATGTALASTPVTVGYRDHNYGGGASRPSGDKPQSKLWYAGGAWWAGMFYNTTVTPKFSEYRIWKLNETTHAWAVQGIGTKMDSRDKSHADYLFDSNTLYVASAHPKADAANPDDRIKFYRLAFNGSTYSLSHAAAVPGSEGGTNSAVIAKGSDGSLWITWNALGKVKYALSRDNGDTWTVAADLPAQLTDIKDGNVPSSDTVAVVAYQNRIGVMWSDHSASPPADTTGNGFWFASIAAADDPAVGGNWTLDAKLPTKLANSLDGEQADNHLNVKVAADGTVYAVGKTGKDTANCATNTTLPLIEFFKRTTAGTWSVYLVSTVADCQTRAQLALDEELGVAYVLLTSPNGGGTIYRKSASLGDLDFRGAASEGAQLGVPFIKSATETLIDDVSTTKQPVTAATGLVAIANNLNPTAARFYLHNELDLVANDNTAPTGTASINADAAYTKLPAVSVAVPATDAGSGVTMVRLANVGTLNGGVLVDSSARSFTYGTPVAWTLTAGEGTKTVWVQWRDAAGNWSAPITETIGLDATAPTGGSVVINSGDTNTETTSVTLDLTSATDGSGSGVTSVLVSNSADFTGAVSFPFAASIPWTLPGGLPALKTVHVKFVDAAGNASTEVTDSITLSDTTAPASAGVPVHTISGPVSGGVPLRLAWTASSAADLDHYIVTRSMDGGAYAQVGLPTTNFFNMNLGSGHVYRFRVYAADHAGNKSPYSVSASFRATNYSESNAALKYSGSWSTASSTSYLNGKAKYSKTAGASATFTVTGNRIGWLSYRSPASGSARVYINGSLVATVSLFSSTYQTKALVFSKSYSSVATRTVKIVVSGTAGHPRVTIDSMFAFR